MKKRYLGIAVALVGLGVFSASCTDEIKFGNAFLEKAPSGDVTIDTVFNNAEYARQYLTGIYSLQYYNLYEYNAGSFPWPKDPYVGMSDAMTDLYHDHYSGTAVVGSYYNMTLTSSNTDDIRKNIFRFSRSNVWEAIRACDIFMENIGRTPDMEESEKNQLVAEAKCLRAARYFDFFRYYGGFPIIEKSFTGTDASYEVPRGSVEECVNFMVKDLDEAIPNLPWSVDTNVEGGKWTQAGAMALKCKILQLAASPIFNADQPYNTNTDATAEQQKAWWYGNYSKERWVRCADACEELLNAIASKGSYGLVEATTYDPKTKKVRPEDYRLAYRNAYFMPDSKEVLHSVRVDTYDAFKSKYYVWHQWGPGSSAMGTTGNGRNFSPTWEYIQMFPWGDGKPFDYKKLDDAGKDTMFTTGTAAKGVHLTRDPRLYENAIVNGVQQTLDWSTGDMSGNAYELWAGGTDGLSGIEGEDGGFATGFGLNKYFLGQDALRKQVHWGSLRLSDIYLTYAEAVLQGKDDFTTALKYVDMIRARVGLKGLAECNPSENLTSNKDNLIAEILRERACELSLEESRWFDILRYKLGDKFLTETLHRLVIHRLGKNGQWLDDDKGNSYDIRWRGNTAADQPYGVKNVEQPTHFGYEELPISRNPRGWWKSSTFDTKWYLQPYPLTEISKGYGLVQNPGW